MTEHEFRAYVVEKLDKLDEAIRGNGKPGLNSRMLLLEEWRDGSKWLNRLLLATVLGLVLTEVWSLITGG